MKIMVNREPCIEVDLNENYSTDAVFETNDDSCVDDCLSAFIDALLLEGYSMVSIVHSMKEYVDEALEDGLDLSIFDEVDNDNY